MKSKITPTAQPARFTITADELEIFAESLAILLNGCTSDPAATEKPVDVLAAWKRSRGTWVDDSVRESSGRESRAKLKAEFEALDDRAAMLERILPQLAQVAHGKTPTKISVELTQSQITDIIDWAQSGIENDMKGQVPGNCREIPEWWKDTGRAQYKREKPINGSLYLRDPEVKLIATLLPHLA